MKKFLSDNSAALVKFISTHVVMSLLGIMVGLAILVIDPDDTTGMSFIALVAGLFLIGFMCFLHYDDMFFIGEKEGIKARGEGTPIDYKKGIKVVLVAYSPTLLLALVVIILKIIALTTGNDDITAGALLLYYGFQGTYIAWAPSILSFFGNAGVFVFIIFSLIPAFVSSVLGYTLGLKDKTLRSIFGIKVKPPYDGPMEQKKKNKQ